MMQQNSSYLFILLTVAVAKAIQYWNASTKTHSATLSTVSFLTEKPRVLYAARVILAVWSEHPFQQYVQLRYLCS